MGQLRLLKSPCARKRTAYLRYSTMFWLFLVGSLLGVYIEGLFCAVHYGRWETHVVSVWGPFCILYGIGAVACYIGHCFLKDSHPAFQFVAYFAVFSVIELLVGLLLEYGLGMRAWNYVNEVLQVRGHICLQNSMVWGIIGLVFSYWIASPVERVFAHFAGNRFMHVFVLVFTVFLAIDFFFTGAAAVRWSKRHYGKAARTFFGRWIDKMFPESFMAKRFVEWRFLQKK